MFMEFVCSIAVFGVVAGLGMAQIISAPLAAEEKVAPAPTLEILYQETGNRLFSRSSIVNYVCRDRGDHLWRSGIREDRSNGKLGTKMHATHR
jgi:hypothetical protein